MMRSPRWLLGLGVAAATLGATAAPASAGTIPSGERVHGQSVLEPSYDDITGVIRYVNTPKGVPDPVNTNPRAAAPFYLPVYPAGSTVGTTLCKDLPEENCPDHGQAVAEAAEHIVPEVYGEGVLGHDHLMGVAKSGGDFNVAWVPTLILFTNKAAANTHVILLSQIEEMLETHEVIEVPLNGTNGTPNLTFHCSIVSETVYFKSSPFLG